MRHLLTILAAFGVLVVGLAVAIAAGWIRLSAVDPFAHMPRPTTQAAIAAQDAAGGDERGGDSSAVPGGAPGTAADAPPEPLLADRTILLKAEDAKLSGLHTSRSDFGAAAAAAWAGRRPPAISTSVVTGWLTPEDAARWTIDVPKAGRYAVTLDYAATTKKRTLDGAPGGYVLTVGEQKITGQVAPTRNGRAFELVDVGFVDLPQGQVTLTIAPDAPLRDPLMNLRSVRLFPAE